MIGTLTAAQTLVSAVLDQDAGNRDESGGTNLFSNRAFARALVVADPPRLVQDAAEGTSPTAVLGTARQQAIYSAGTTRASSTSTRLVPPTRISGERFVPLQKWEGTVLER